jgi:hypothetical protein
MNVPLIWPRISDKTSATRAVRVGFWIYVLLTILNASLGIYLLVSRQRLLDYDPFLGWVFVELGVLFGIVAWRLWRNSRIWALIGIVTFAWFFHDKLRPAPGAIIPILSLLALFGAGRGSGFCTFRAPSPHREDPYCPTFR